MRAAPAVFMLIRRMTDTSFYITFIMHKLPCCRLQLIIISIPPSVKGFFAFRFFLCYNNPKTAAAAAGRTLCAYALPRVVLGTLQHAKPQHVRFCWNRFAASCYNNPKTAAAAAGRTLCAYALPRVVLGTLQHAKPQHVRFCWGRFAASCYNNPKTAAAAAGHTLCAYAAARLCARVDSARAGESMNGLGAFLMRVVVKVGTSTLAHKTGCLNIRLVETLCKTLADLQNAGHQIVLVSSGAIGMGVGKLQLGARPSDMATKQAAAAVGQCELMYTYDKLFTEYNHTVAQVLLTAADIEDKMRRHNVETTLQRLLQLGAIPVINENDTVSTAEIAEVSTLGDNDTLASIVAVSVEADLLVLLSALEGLYTADPHKDPDAVLIREVAAITPDIEALAGGAGSGQGTGGMVTKLRAARRVTQQGIPMVIANGADPLCLYDIVEGKPVGTRFLGNAQA